MTLHETRCPHCDGVVFSRMTEPQQAEAVKRYLAGETLNELAARYNRGVTTIRRLLAKNNARKRKPKLKEE